MACGGMLEMVYLWSGCGSKVRGIVFNLGRFYGAVREQAGFGLAEFKNNMLGKIL